MNLDITFADESQRDFYFATARNQCFSGGFNNGKTYGSCLKNFTLLSTFPNYRMAIARQVYADLKRTTMQTFFKICPGEMIERHNEQDGFTLLKNKSAVYWLHLDAVQENTLRGLEINSASIDQAEETSEKTYDILDARIGRWDNAEVPQSLLNQFPEWPHRRNKPLVPSYMMVLCNPDTQYHYIYRKYHPNSIERRPNYFYVEGQWNPELGSEETYIEALKHDAEWVDKYVKGQWGKSKAQIHYLAPESILEPTDELLDEIKRKGNLFRSFDHGEASPSCCIWWAVLKGVFIAYREYYMPNQVVSIHRQNIFDLSAGETYTSSYADPQIFKKTSQKDGAFWTTADEYLTNDIAAPAIAWLPADNNEFATRNRINELLRPNFVHPVTGEPNSPGIYFIKQTREYPYGVSKAIVQVPSQRRKLLTYLEGKAIYCDEREDSVEDHAYDCVRYFVSMHGTSHGVPSRPAPRMSFKYYRLMANRHRGLVAASA